MNEILDPYAKATVENFRRTPVNLRARLLDLLVSEMKENSPESSGTVPSFHRIPRQDRTEEFMWLAEKGSEYQGQWVALQGNQLLAHDLDYHQVSAEVKKLGAQNPMFMFIEAEESEDFLRFLP